MTDPCHNISISTEIASIFVAPSTLSISAAIRADAPTTKYQVDIGAAAAGDA
jgi:hypothetical protein